MDRVAIGKKTRFEIFKRDNFTCKYCGAKAPTVPLHVDHITPVSKGGSNELTNLVTACQPCNAGKSDRELQDTQVIDAQREALEDKQAKAEMLQMMADWGNELVNGPTMADSFFDVLRNALGDRVNPTAAGKKKMNKVIDKFGFELVMESLKIALDAYGDDIERIVNKIGGICRNKELESHPRTAWAYTFANSLIYTKQIRSTGSIGYMRNVIQGIYEEFMTNCTPYGSEDHFTKKNLISELPQLVDDWEIECGDLQYYIECKCSEHQIDTDRQVANFLRQFMEGILNNSLLWHYTRHDEHGGCPEEYDDYRMRNRIARLNGECS